MTDILAAASIRAAQSSDFKPVGLLLKAFMTQHNRWHPEHYRPMVQPFNQGTFTAWLARPNEAHLVAEVEAQVIGYLYGALLTSVGTPFTFQRHGAQVAALFVEPEFRGIGVGRSLCSQFDAWARDSKADFVVLNVSPYNHQAHGFYTALGFNQFNEYLTKKL